MSDLDSGSTHSNSGLCACNLNLQSGGHGLNEAFASSSAGSDGGVRRLHYTAAGQSCDSSAAGCSPKSLNSQRAAFGIAIAAEPRKAATLRIQPGANG